MKQESHVAATAADVYKVLMGGERHLWLDPDDALEIATDLLRAFSMMNLVEKEK